MSLERKFYDILFKGATAFNGSNDLMHVGIIGMLPFFTGYLGSKAFGMGEHDVFIGCCCSAASEAIWQFLLEPKSPYDHPADKKSDLKGIVETSVGVGLAYLITRVL